jgi:hypothetical protein
MPESSAAGREVTTPDTSGDALPLRELPLSIIWLHAVDPRIFTPISLEKGRPTRIRITSPDHSTDVSVYRTVSVYLDGNRGIQDEIFTNYENAGSQFNYELDSERRLIKYNPTPNATPHMQRVIEELSGLESIPGSTIEAVNMDFGLESHFISNGSCWIEVKSGEPIAYPEAITVGQLAIGNTTNN